ncbi:MAG TPA: NUDIX hydrolase [Mucilaginibacter sp.]|jgi:ADP-ribose pyrophosphatase
MKHKRLSTKIEFSGKSTTVLNQKVSFDNKICVEFEIVDRPAVALIIPLLSETQVIIIKQYRASVDAFIWEFPAGKKMDGESIQRTALRELEEETGFKATQLTLIGEFYTAPHFTNEKVYVFVAMQIERAFAKFQEHEFISVHIIDIQKINALFNGAEIKDSKSVLAFQFFNNKKKHIE